MRGIRVTVFGIAVLAGSGAVPGGDAGSAGGAREADIGAVRARGPLHELVLKSYAHLLAGPAGFGSDWDNPDEPGDGRGRWMIAVGHCGAYLGEKPPKMLEEMRRMEKMRNPRGFFGLDRPPEVVQAQASFDNSWPIQWGVDFTRRFGDPAGLAFAVSIADAFYVPRTPYFAPYAEAPKGHWMGEYGHPGVGIGGMVGLARLAKATGEERHARAARALADLFLGTRYEGWHGHCTSTAVLGLAYVYELTGERKYLDAARAAADVVFRGTELPYLGHSGGIVRGCDHSEGCGVSDLLHLHLLLGRLTGEARWFDKAELILWGPFFHHIRPTGGMGVDGLDPSRTQLGVHGFEWGYQADCCCTMWAANGVARVFTHTVLADESGLTVPLCYPFTASATLRGKRVELAMDTAYPDAGAAKLRLARCEAEGPWNLRLRVPRWSAVRSLAVNGKPAAGEARDGWLVLDRVWAAGDEVAVELAMPVWIGRLRSEEPIAPPPGPGTLVEDVRLFRGPLLLALARSRNPGLDWRETRLTLVIPAGSPLDLPARPAPGGFDPRFLYPGAHREVRVAPPGWPAAGPAAVPGVTFASDLPWAKDTAGAGNTVHRDTNHGGGTISVAGRRCAKGVWTHSFPDETPADVVIDIAGRGYETFAARVGPEDSCGGTVRFQVIADGKTAAESRVLRGGEALDLRADVTGAREVTLRVGNGGDGNGCDHAAWGLARFLAPGAADPFAGDAAAVPVDLSSLKGDRVRTAVLTPIAEGPGRTGSSPQDVKGRACAEREAVLFDAAIVPAASAR